MARSFTKIVAFAFVLTFVFGMARTSRAQDANKDVIQPITKAGSAAMIFELSGIGTFGIGGPGILGFPSSAVGMKYFMSDGMALFVLAGFNTTSGSPTNPDSMSAKPSTTTLGIAAGIQDHFRPLNSTSPYVGGMVSFASGPISGSPSDNGASGNLDEKTSSSTFGVQALAGFDWYFTNGLCLGGEVSLGFASTSNSVTGPNEGATASVTTKFQSVTTIALATGASVHLDVFF
jgi:hypothetical protein